MQEVFVWTDKEVFLAWASNKSTAMRADTHRDKEVEWSLKAEMKNLNLIELKN